MRDSRLCGARLEYAAARGTQWRIRRVDRHMSLRITCTVGATGCAFTISLCLRWGTHETGPASRRLPTGDADPSFSPPYPDPIPITDSLNNLKSIINRYELS